MSVIRVKRATELLTPTLKSGELGVVDTNLYFGKYANGDTAATATILANQNSDNSFTGTNIFKIGADDFQIWNGTDGAKKTYSGSDGWLYASAGFNDIDSANQNILVNRSYVDSKVQGLNVKSSVVIADSLTGFTYSIASYGTLTANFSGGPTTIQSHTFSTGDRVLVKGRANAYENGIYKVTEPGSTEVIAELIRSLDSNSWAELVSAFVFVEKGTSADTGWVCSADSNGSLGGTALPWSQFSGAGTFSADNSSLTLTGTEFSINTTWAGQTAITTLGTIVTGTWQGSEISSTYITTGIADSNVVIVAGTVLSGDYAKFTSTGLQGRDTDEVRGDLNITDENIQDLVDAMFIGGDFTTVTYDDTAATLTIDGENTTYSVFGIGADGLVPGPIASSTGLYLRGDGTWAKPTDLVVHYSAGNGVSESGTVFSVAGGTGLTQEASGLKLTSIAAGATTVGALEYNGTTAGGVGRLNGNLTTAPTGETRLNYEGYFYATKFEGLVDGGTWA